MGRTLNGALLRAANEEFDAFIKLDRGLRYQQDLSSFALCIVVIRAVSNQYRDLLPLAPSLRSALERARPGEVVQVTG